MRKPRNANGAIQQKPVDYKPPKHRQPSNRQKSALMGFYAAARKKSGAEA